MVPPAFFFFPIVSLLLFLVPFALGGFHILPPSWSGPRNYLLVIVSLNALALLSRQYRQFMVKFYRNLDEYIQKYHLLHLLCGLYLFAFVKVLLHNYFSFNVYANDFSVFDLIVPNTLKGIFFYSPVCECNHFGTHATPIIFLLTPLYLIFHSPMMTNLASGLILWSSCFPLIKLARLYALEKRQQLLILFAFFNFSFVARILKYNFHIEVFYVPLFLWFFYFLTSGKRPLAFLTSCLILMVKEDGAVYLGAAAFFYTLLYKKDRLLCFSILAISLLTFFINIKYLIPSQRGTESYQLVTTFAPLREIKDLGDLLSWVGGNISTVFTQVVTGKWLKILLPFLFLPLTDLWFVLAAAPFILIHAVAPGQMNTLMVYYSAPLVPFIFFSFIRKTQKFPRLFIPICLLCSIVGGGSFTFIDTSAEYKFLGKVLSKIPDGASVCTQGSLFPQLGYSKNLHLLTPKLTPPCLERELDFYLINPQLGLYPNSPKDLQDFIDQINQKSHYQKELVGNFHLYKKLQKSTKK